MKKFTDQEKKLVLNILRLKIKINAAVQNLVILKKQLKKAEQDYQNFTKYTKVIN